MKIHQCEYLKYQDQIIELVFEGEDNYQRWALKDADGLYQRQVILFCPCCGYDFRSDCLWQIAGRPQENAILAKARIAGQLKKSLDSARI